VASWFRMALDFVEPSQGRDERNNECRSENAATAAPHRSEHGPQPLDLHEHGSLLVTDSGREPPALDPKAAARPRRPPHAAGHIRPTHFPMPVRRSTLIAMTGKRWGKRAGDVWSTAPAVARRGRPDAGGAGRGGRAEPPVG